METKDETKSNDNVKIIGALLLGAAIGVGLGMLFAPDKGSETRKKATEKGEDVLDDIKNKFNDLVDEIKEGFENGKQEVKDFTDKA